MSKKHCFQHGSRFSFSHFSIIFQPDGRASQISHPSLFQIRNQTEGLESECQGSEVSAPTHLKGPNKASNRNLITSHFPLFTFTRNSVDTSGQSQLRSPAHVQRNLQFHWSSLFSIPRNPGS